MLMEQGDPAVGPKQKAITAIREGREEDAIRFVLELSDELKPLHDRYCDWIQCLLAFISEKMGEDAVEEAHSRVFDSVYKRRAITLSKLNHDELLKAYCQSLRSHYADFQVVEDDENITINIKYCGSGGRLQKEGAGVGHRSSIPYPWSFGQKDVCYYCCHESVFNRKYEELGLNFVRFQYARQFDDDGQPTGDSCRWIIAKKR